MTLFVCCLPSKYFHYVPLDRMDLIDIYPHVHVYSIVQHIQYSKRTAKSLKLENNSPGFIGTVQKTVQVNCTAIALWILHFIYYFIYLFSRLFEEEKNERKEDTKLMKQSIMFSDILPMQCVEVVIPV